MKGSILKGACIAPILILALVAFPVVMPVAHAENAKTTAQADVQDFQNILKILQPLNVKQVDQVSKQVFEDFFEQKNRIYQTVPAQAAPKNGEKSAVEQSQPVQPPRGPRRTF